MFSSAQPQGELLVFKETQKSMFFLLDLAVCPRSRSPGEKDSVTATACHKQGEGTSQSHGTP